ncbi:MAG: tetratricopeptide repeat protein [Deltaproteobacteria bacterium]|nr:tetratricopeptide repeat protein [Deltaproteobacteria bacterium]
MRRISTLCVSIVFTTIMCAAAFAQPAPSPSPGEDPGVASKRLYAAGIEAYNLGEFSKAADLFKQAYKTKADPVFLFNVAQSLRLDKKPGEAAVFYRSFLRNMPQAPNKLEVEQQIKDMDAAQAVLDAEAKKKAEEEERRRIEEEERRKKIPDPSDVNVPPGGDQLPPGDGPKPIYKKWWFWTAIGAVAVGATVAVVVLAGGSEEVSPPGSDLGNTVVFR